MRIDLHQHLLPVGLLDALRSRRQPPRVSGHSPVTLHLSGEPDGALDLTEHDPGIRVSTTPADLIGLSLSCALGIDQLDPAQAQPLLDLWHDGAEQLGAPFGTWVSIALVEPDLEVVRRDLLRPRALGLQLPAPALATPDDVARLGDVLALCAELDRPVLVHPGPARIPDGARAPSWWPALVPYLAQQAAAWFAWHAAGVGDHPDLRIGFVALAGLAPLHHERLAVRGGAFRVHPNVYYETSSYSARAIDALVRVVGVDALVHGSDEPNAHSTDPGLGEAFARLLFATNPARFLGGDLRDAAPGGDTVNDILKGALR